MRLPSSNLTPEERRTLGIAALTAAATTLTAGLISWGFEEVKRLLAERRAVMLAPPRTTP